jgi:hypothetical protein
MPTKREYSVIDANSLPSLQTKLNEAARTGFEVVTAFHYGGELIAAILVKITEGNRVQPPSFVTPSRPPG